MKKADGLLTAEEIPKIERVEIDRNRVSKFSTEEEFTAIAVDLVVETTSYVTIAACTMGAEPTWDRDRACVGGNMVRLYKLLDAVLDQTCKKRQEIAFILARLVFETLVNIRFLIKEHSSDLVDSYVAYSLRHERKLRDRIRKNVEARGGTSLPIEDRMLRSIERSALASTLSLDEVDPQKSGPWGRKNLFEKSSAVGLEEAYLGAFGGTSHSVHGNWHELYGNHLSWNESGRFAPNLDWHRPRPQVLLALCVMTIETLGPYFEFMAEGTGASLDEIHGALSDLNDRIAQLVEFHEAYLSKKVWPEI